MPSSSVRSLLIALVACVPLVLAPALRPRACPQALPGGHGCCGQPVPGGDACCSQPAESDCCCADRQDGPSPVEPGVPGDRPGKGDPCRCHHAPDPWIPAEDQVPPTMDSGARALGSPPLARFETLPVKAAAFEARAGPPGRPEQALHLRHCVFLI